MSKRNIHDIVKESIVFSKKLKRHHQPQHDEDEEGIDFSKLFKHQDEDSCYTIFILMMILQWKQ